MSDVQSAPPDSTPPPPRLAMDLVDVDKHLLRFPVSSLPSGAIISDTLTVTNAATTHVAFKVKTTNQHRYIVRPNLGLIPPRGSSDIFIGLQPTSEPPELGPSRDKFLLRVIEAPELADSKLPSDFWTIHEKDLAVRDIKFRVEFVQHSPSSQPSQQSLPQNEVTEGLPSTAPAPLATSAAPHPRDLPPSTSSQPTHPTHTGTQQEALATSSTQLPIQNGVHQLMEGRDFDAAIERVRHLQQMLDAKNLELARLKTQLAETNAQTQAVLDNAPKAPISANKLLSDPFGGVSIAGIGLMLLLFLILVNVILRIL